MITHLPFSLAPIPVNNNLTTSIIAVIAGSTKLFRTLVIERSNKIDGIHITFCIGPWDIIFYTFCKQFVYILVLGKNYTYYPKNSYYLILVYYVFQCLCIKSVLI